MGVSHYGGWKAAKVHYESGDEDSEEGVFVPEQHIAETLVDQVIEKYSPHHDLYKRIERVVRKSPDDALKKDLFFCYTSRWFGGGSPCAVEGSYLGGLVFLHIPGAESGVMYSSLSDSRTSFTKVVGPDEFKVMLKVFDMFNKTDVCGFYKEFLHRPSKFVKSGSVSELESILSGFSGDSQPSFGL